MQVGLATAAITFAILWCVAQIALKSRGEIGLGLGDVKLLTALAIWLGLATPWVVSGAALIALATVAIIRPAGGKLAFGPFIVIAGWLTGMGGELGLWPTTV